MKYDMQDTVYKDKHGVEVKEGDLYFWDEGVVNGHQYNKELGRIFEDSGKLYAGAIKYWNESQCYWKDHDDTIELQFICDNGFEIINQERFDRIFSE